MDCSICPGIKNWFTGFKFFFSKEFKTENYYKHFFYSIALACPSVIILLNFFHLDETPILFHIFIGGFGAFAVNGIREAILEEKYKAPFSWTDIYMGSYGGMVGACIADLIFKILVT